MVSTAWGLSQKVRTLKRYDTRGQYCLGTESIFVLQKVAIPKVNTTGEMQPNVRIPKGSKTIASHDQTRLVHCWTLATRSIPMEKLSFR